MNRNLFQKFQNTAFTKEELQGCDKSQKQFGNTLLQRKRLMKLP